MTFRHVVGAVLCAFVFLFNQPIVAFAQDAAPAVEAATAVTTGQLVGFDGKTTWTGQRVRLVDAGTGKLIAEVTSGEQGRFKLPELAPGTYLVNVGQVVARLTVTAEKPVREMRLLVSAEQLRGEEIPLADLNQVAEENAGTSLILILGTTALIAISFAAGAIVAHNGLGHDDKKTTIVINNPPVSPSQP